MECDICAELKVKSSLLKSNSDLLTLGYHHARYISFVFVSFCLRSGRINIDKTFDCVVKEILELLEPFVDELHFFQIQMCLKLVLVLYTWIGISHHLSTYEQFRNRLSSGQFFLQYKFFSFHIYNLPIMWTFAIYRVSTNSIMNSILVTIKIIFGFQIKNVFSSSVTLNSSVHIECVESIQHWCMTYIQFVEIISLLGSNISHRL